MTKRWIWRHRDDLAVLAGLGGITISAWIYVVITARRMAANSTGMTERSMEPMMNTMAGAQPWTPTEFGLRLMMWTVMMVAMMLPGAAPMALLYAAVARKAATKHNPLRPTFAFATGYLMMWMIFSLGATTAQHALDQATLLSPMMASNSALLGAVLLIAAGVYQFTPLKNACLRNCRVPAHFLARYWRTGALGALRMGLRHGAYCLGCCWILMGLLFIGGVMNLLWIAAIALFILLEKTIPLGDVSGRFAGAAMILAGALSLAL